MNVLSSRIKKILGNSKVIEKEVFVEKENKFEN